MTSLPVTADHIQTIIDTEELFHLRLLTQTVTAAICVMARETRRRSHLRDQAFPAQSRMLSCEMCAADMCSPLL